MSGRAWPIHVRQVVHNERRFADRDKNGVLASNLFPYLTVAPSQRSPCQVHTVLTDNGVAFTEYASAKWGDIRHLSDRLCDGELKPWRIHQRR